MTNFENLFYHDTLIHEFSFSYKENEKTISFILENEESERIKCEFNGISEISLDIGLRIHGPIYVSHAYVSMDDELLVNFKNQWKLSTNIIEQLKCYIISSSIGEIKIISENDLCIVSE